ncbi:hypothetical protein CL684_00685 [Candidatus Campbellbacteria bacterium]|nr:hypothetical protein [Candidatus Campbellbacteria bacterium]|tara:strand:+ start:6995 stop:8596 length:1602 start_codon:yes stop_codon:yes gene_type:complete
MKKISKTIKKSITGIAIISLVALASVGIVQNAAAQGDLAAGGGNFSLTQLVPRDVSGLVSRVGSLTIGSLTPNPNISLGFMGCTNENFAGTPCLIVEGASTFAKLWSDGDFLNTSLVGVSSLSEVGSFAVLDNGNNSPTLVVDDLPGTDDSIMISSLAYYENGVFAPRDTTTQRLVCATTAGKLVTCGEPGGGDGSNPTDGQCGSADGGTYASAPTSNLCDEGTASSVSYGSGARGGSGGWTWTCYGTSGGSNDNCSASVPPNTYSWYTGAWGSCTGGSGGSCSGTPTGGSQGAKIDWNGNLFDWTDGTVYESVGGNPDTITVCAGPDDLHDLSSGKNLDYNAAISNTACFRESPPYSWTNPLYEPSLDAENWHQLQVTPGTGGDRTNPGNSSTPGWINQVNNLGASPLYQQGQLYQSYCSYDGTTPNTQIDCGPGGSYGIWVDEGTSCSPITNSSLPTPPNYAGDTICVNQNTLSCNGSSQSSCEAVSGCNWSGGTPGTQTRLVQCRDQNGNVVQNEDFCTPPSKPAETQTC